MLAKVAVHSAHTMKGWDILNKFVIFYMTFLTTHHNCLNHPKFYDEEYKEYLRLKSSSQAQSSLIPSVSTTGNSQSVEIQGPWIVDSDAFHHIFGNNSLFSFISSPKLSLLLWFQSCISESW